jgi:hypothetical protein
MISIPLTQGKVAIVDDEDAELASSNWQTRLLGQTWYAQRNVRLPSGRKTMERLHTAVWRRAHPGKSHPSEIDHKNGNGLDNRRSNLRSATHQENNRNRRLQSNNTSGFKGVHWETCTQKWRASIKISGRQIRLGRFKVVEEAARVYDAKARAFFKDFATLNFPKGSEQSARNITGGIS